MCGSSVLLNYLLLFIFLPGLVFYKYKAEVRLLEFARYDVRLQVNDFV